MKQAFCLLPRSASSYRAEIFTFRLLVPHNLLMKHIWTLKVKDHLFVSLCGYITVCELWFWWKTPESEDSLITHTPNEGVCTTLCHYWKRKRQKVWATFNNEGWFTFFIYISSSLILHSLLQRVSLSDVCFITFHDRPVVFQTSEKAWGRVETGRHRGCAVSSCLWPLWWFRNKQNVSGKAAENQKRVTFCSVWKHFVCYITRENSSFFETSEVKHEDIKVFFLFCLPHSPLHLHC